MILSTLPSRESTILIKSFSEITDTTHEAPTSGPSSPSSARERAKLAAQPPAPLPIRILVGHSNKIGKGLNLTRASTVILFEPDILFQREAQIYSRVHRIGQRSVEGSESYRLWSETARARRRDLHDKIGNYWAGESWEWEGRVVDRIKYGRKLTFGRQLEAVMEHDREQRESFYLETPTNEDDEDIGPEIKPSPVDGTRHPRGALGDFEFGDLALRASR